VNFSEFSKISENLNPGRSVDSSPPPHPTSTFGHWVIITQNTKPHCDKTMPIFYDDDGKVLATKGLVVTPPWVVLKSNKFDGRQPKKNFFVFVYYCPHLFAYTFIHTHSLRYISEKKVIIIFSTLKPKRVLGVWMQV
jgi:hypothetical protein